MHISNESQSKSAHLFFKQNLNTHCINRYRHEQNRLAIHTCTVCHIEKKWAKKWNLFCYRVRSHISSGWVAHSDYIGLCYMKFSLTCDACHNTVTHTSDFDFIEYYRTLNVILWLPLSVQFIVLPFLGRVSKLLGCCQ